MQKLSLEKEKTTSFFIFCEKLALVVSFLLLNLLQK